MNADQSDSPKSEEANAAREFAKLIELQTQIRPVVDTFRNGDMNLGFYVNLVRAAFSKAFDFCIAATRPENDPLAFLLTPALRGACEDLVVLGALRDVAETKRERVASAMVQCEMRSALDRQEAFFGQQRPFQPIMLGSKWPRTEADLLAEAQAAWADIGYALGGKSIRPSTKSLATKVEIEQLYEYLYAITSDVVHFNPRVLLRTGWGKDVSRPTFSIENFSRYYRLFCVCYGHHILSLFYGHFRTLIDAPGTSEADFSELRNELAGWLRWPEIMTFEECNLKEPAEVLRVLYRVAHENGGPSWHEAVT